MIGIVVFCYIFFMKKLLLIVGNENNGKSYQNRYIVKHHIPTKRSGWIVLASGMRLLVVLQSLQEVYRAYRYRCRETGITPMSFRQFVQQRFFDKHRTAEALSTAAWCDADIDTAIDVAQKNGFEVHLAVITTPYRGKKSQPISKDQWANVQRIATARGCTLVEIDANHDNVRKLIAYFS